MNIVLPAVHVAVQNSSKIGWDLEYAQEIYHYPPGDYAVVPLEVAHKHFGFELDPHNRLFRNTANRYEDGEETQFYQARASTLPWGWENDQTKIEDEDITRAKKFKALKDSFETGITGKLITAPKKLTKQVYDSLPV
jgi:hypothetical protein